MNQSIYRHLAAITLLATSLSTLATETPIQPRAGAWQVNSQFFLFSKPVPNVGKVISMGPEKLQLHVNNMLHQNHVRLNGDGSASLCVSEQQIANNDFVNDQGSGCNVGKGRRVGRVIFFYIQCEAPSGSGLTTVRLLDNEHWEATTQLIVTVRGVAQYIDNKSEGTWQSASCAF